MDEVSPYAGAVGCRALLLFLGGTRVACNRSMRSRAKLFGHPGHQMLVTFPIGAFGLSIVGDALHSFSHARKYAEAATLALDVGLASAALAIPFGVVDWVAIPSGTRAKRIGLWHMLGNAAMLGLFGASRWTRSRDKAAPTAKALSCAAFMLSGGAAWLGGELVSRHGIGVEGYVADEPERRVKEASKSMPLSDEAPTLPGIPSVPARRTSPVR